MEKKMRNILIALIIGFQVFPITVYGKGKDAFLAYQEAMQKTVVSGNWKEELDMDADMTIIQGKAKTKTKVTLDAVTEVSGYDENDSSAVQMTGSASMAVLGQKYIWNMTYRDGTAHYEYKEPVSKGIQTGTAHVFFQDTNTGYMSEIPVTVYKDHEYSYTVNAVPVQYIEKEYATNIYNMNGLYIDNYAYEINKDNRTASVSFDVYNSSYIYGSVETYDENGRLKDVILIKKMSSSNTSMKGALWDNTSGLISDLKDGTIGSYRQKSGFSKKTSVKIEIPKDGYIKISNDPQDSAVVNIINSADLLIGIGKLAKTIKNFDVDSEVFSKALTKKLLESKTFVTLIEDGSELPQNLCKGVSDKVFFRQNRWVHLAKPL